MTNRDKKELPVTNALLYNGKFLQDPRGMAMIFRPGGASRDLVQWALNRVPVWTPGEDPIHTVRLPRNRRLIQFVVERRPSDELYWGIHKTHRAAWGRQALPMPFVNRAGVLFTNHITLELSGTVDAPVLTSVTSGHYVPPPPWAPSAVDAVDDDGFVAGTNECWGFWQNYAYIYKLTNIVGRVSKFSPGWWVNGNLLYGRAA